MYRRLIVLVFLSLFLFWQSFSVESIPAEENRRISVEIRGEIKNPGVYELRLGTTYEDLFALICRADQALYVVKKRTHSAEYGGHERRRSDQHYKGKAEVSA